MLQTIMEYSEFFGHLEDTITKVVRTCHPTSWEENHISFSLADKMFKRNQVISLEGLDRPFKIIWDFRKIRLPDETVFGDIGIIVRLTSWAGENIEGVGLLEAKKRDLKKGTFSAAKSSQLKRITSKVPPAQLLLYDYDSVSECMDNWSIQFEDHFYRRRFGTMVPFTHCVCLPAKTAISLGTYTTDLHKFGVPLSYQIVSRYFRGFDLEMEPRVVDSVKGNIDRHGGTRILMLVGISTGDVNPELPSVNDNIYSKPS